MATRITFSDAHHVHGRYSGLTRREDMRVPDREVGESVGVDGSSCKLRWDRCHVKSIAVVVNLRICLDLLRHGASRV
jgi:hypothetical protein